MAEEKTKPFQMRVSPEWLATIDEWRRHQPDLPSRAEAIRRLVEGGLAARPASMPEWEAKMRKMLAQSSPEDDA